LSLALGLCHIEDAISPECASPVPHRISRIQ
jgi:hypothetical protein